VILRHLSNTVNSFLCSSTNYIENRLLPNDLIIIRNHGDDEEDECDIKRVLERQGDAHIKVVIQSNSEFPSLTLSPTRSPGSPRLQLDIPDAYEIGFGCSTYVQKEDEINFTMELVLGPNKIGSYQNCQNNFNIESSTCPGAVHIITDAHIAYDIQLGFSWSPWKCTEIKFPMEPVPYPNSSGINRIRQNNWTSRIYFGVVPPFLVFGLCIVSSPLGLCTRHTCTSLYPL
jgi:hypothetical protein